jgi:hypothetical protein
MNRFINLPSDVAHVNALSDSTYSQSRRDVEALKQASRSWARIPGFGPGASVSVKRGLMTAGRLIQRSSDDDHDVDHFKQMGLIRFSTANSGR